MGHACLWQTLVLSCVNVCPHVNKPEFQPLNQVVFVHSAIGYWSSLLSQIHQNSGPVHE